MHENLCLPKLAQKLATKRRIMLLMTKLFQTANTTKYKNSSRKRVVIVVEAAATFCTAAAQAFGFISGSHTHTAKLRASRARRYEAETRRNPPTEILALLFKFLCNLKVFVSCVSEFAASVCRL